jgi:predicted DCC family thiol-disulfide oxidoreductase YuxK
MAFENETEQIQFPVIVFDGYCVLCMGSVRFILKRDKKHKFRFLTTGQALESKMLKDTVVNQPGTDSIVLFENGKMYLKSTAALHIARQLTGLWPVLYVFLLVPRFLRDWVYDVIARNRYRWFGKKDTCFIPSPEQKKYFPGQFE